MENSTCMQHPSNVHYPLELLLFTNGTRDIIELLEPGTEVNKSLVAKGPFTSRFGSLPWVYCGVHPA